MRRLALLVLGLAIRGPAFADPFEDAKAAYRKGDYVTALRLWRLLADGGDSNAQVWPRHRDEAERLVLTWQAGPGR